MLAEADLVAKGLVAELAGERSRPVVAPPGVDFEPVRRREHFLTLRTRVHLPWLCHHHHDDDDVTIVIITVVIIIIIVIINKIIVIDLANFQQNSFSSSIPTAIGCKTQFPAKGENPRKLEIRVQCALQN